MPHMPEAPRVLVVDDDGPIRSLITAIMRRQGITVDSAADGEEGVRKLESCSYDVVLLDLMMPRMNGYEVLAYIKEHHRHYPAVIVISAQGDPAIRLKLDPKLVHSIVRKPFDIEMLADLVVSTASEISERNAKKDAEENVVPFPGETKSKT